MDEDDQTHISEDSKKPIQNKRLGIVNNLSLMKPLFGEGDFRRTQHAPMDSATIATTTGKGTKSSTSTEETPIHKKKLDETQTGFFLSANLMKPLCGERDSPTTTTIGEGPKAANSRQTPLPPYKGKGTWQDFSTLLDAVAFMSVQDCPQKPEQHKRKGEATSAITENRKKGGRFIVNSHPIPIIYKKPVMPLKMANTINALGGTRLKYIFCKEINTTDVNPAQSRLVLPKSEVERALSQTEIECLKGNTKMQVLVVDTGCRMWEMTFGWRPSIEKYVFVTMWNAFVTKNEIKAYADDVYVWSFRLPQQDGKEHLCFAVNVQPTMYGNFQGASSSGAKFSA